MRDIARRLGTGRTARALALTATVALWGVTQTAPAVAASLPPTISSAFTPNVVGVGETTAIGFTVSDPNASGSFTNLAFTDTLGDGGVVDNPNGLNTSGCGSNVTVTANPGDTTISVAAATVKAGTPCVISVAVTSSTAETVTSQTSAVTSSGPTSSASGSAAVLTVLAAPTVTVTNPVNNAKYRFGQKVAVQYTCALAAYAVGLEGCTAQDDAGNTIVTGGLLDTTIPGLHQLTVQAISSIGLVTDQTVSYTVLPDNTFSLASLKHSTSKIGFRLKLPGSGKVKITAWSGKSKLATLTVSVRGKKTLKVSLPVTAGSGKVKLVVVYTPKGGVAKSLTKHLTIG